jgi:hypothetical protein
MGTVVDNTVLQKDFLKQLDFALPVNTPPILHTDLSSRVFATDSFYVKFEVFKAVARKNGVFWDVTDVSEELSASIIRVTRIGELGTTLAVASNRRGERASSVYSRIQNCQFPCSPGITGCPRTELLYANTWFMGCLRRKCLFILLIS